MDFPPQSQASFQRIPSGYSLRWTWKWRLGLQCFVRRNNMFLVLAGSAAEVQTRLHQSFPVQSARAGAKEMGEEGAGGFSRPTVRCCSQAEEAEESPQCQAYPSQWYCASSHPHLAHQLYCQLSHCSCSGCLPRPVTHTDTEQRARGIVSNHNVLFFKAYTDIFFRNEAADNGNILLNYTIYSHLCFP